VTEPIKGVQYAPPPAAIAPYVHSQIDEFIKGLPDGRSGMFHLSIDTDKGIQGAFVQRFDGEAIDFDAVAWVGTEKGWGTPLRGGIALRGSWNWKR
jgi:hypothetical protein